MTILEQVRQIVTEYGTSDARRILEQTGVALAYVPMANLRGIYKQIERNIFISINSNLDERIQMLVAGHELGHVVLHPGTNRVFLDRCTCLKTSPQERQADTFSVCLLAPWPEDILEDGDTVDNIAAKLGVDIRLARLYADEALKGGSNSGDIQHF